MVLGPGASPAWGQQVFDSLGEWLRLPEDPASCRSVAETCARAAVQAAHLAAQQCAALSSSNSTSQPPSSVWVTDPGGAVFIFVLGVLFFPLLDLLNLGRLTWARLLTHLEWQIRNTFNTASGQAARLQRQPVQLAHRSSRLVPWRHATPELDPPEALAAAISEIAAGRS